MTPQVLGVRPIRVLIVDDSALARQALTTVLASARDIAVMGTAGDPFQAAAKLKVETPDVIILDIEMPRMDGLTFLRKLMRQHPIPTIICSSLAEAGSPAALTALELGAVEIIQKPALGTRAFYEESSQRIHDAVRAAASSRVRRLGLSVPPPTTTNASRPPKPVERRLLTSTTDRVVVVGASTGGTEAIRSFLEGFGPDAPGMAIVQHMPPGFTAGFAARLDRICRVGVREACTGDSIARGQVLIAPAGKHLAVRRSGGHYEVEVLDGDPVNRHKPSVDVLFNSTVEACGANAVGVILTGMGDDGARGMKALFDAGAETLAQDEATCIVYGMPREAVRAGGVKHVLPLDALAEQVLRACA